ncbi:MAG: lysophospholipid acyltransferase family protein [Myxococcota bacterium]|nr:lysophospholipid acyltransferase family protein [Myxococcota bacterium]
MDPLGPVRLASRALGFATWTSAVVYGHKALSLFDSDLATPWGKQRFIDAWSHGVFPLFGLDLNLVSGEVPEGGVGPFLVVANHRSPLDILVAIHLVGGVVLSHHGVREIPVVGTAAVATDTIFVDRDDRRSGARAIRSMRRALVEGRNLIVFPEGTTYPGDEVRPFLRGAFAAARGLDLVRVLPLGLAYRPGDEFYEESFGDHFGRMARRRRTPIWAAVGEPMDVPRTPDDTEALRQRVQGLVDEASAARDS